MSRLRSFLEAMGGGGWECPFLPFLPFRGWLSFVCGHLLFLQSQPCRISPALHILIGERFSDFVDTCDLAAYPPTPTSINPGSSPHFKVLNHTTQSLLLCKIILPGSRDQGIDILRGGGIFLPETVISSNSFLQEGTPDSCSCKSEDFHLRRGHYFTGLPRGMATSSKRQKSLMFSPSNPHTQVHVLSTGENPAPCPHLHTHHMKFLKYVKIARFPFDTIVEQIENLLYVGAILGFRDTARQSLISQCNPSEGRRWIIQ